MKKTIIILGAAFIAFSNVSFASNESFPKTISTVEFSSTPLCVAISKGEVEVVKKFVEYGADVNEMSNDMTPLMVAARYNNVEIIKFLLENGANKDKKNEKGYTALKYATLSNAKEAMELLKK
ncbi:ankyrin repeat domain-containing protein [Flavobacterium sp.]|uniref:ankyrin repeat domain-containing protein n=1 Tax=Flavobacterium sp. TaxID=239 RepID=UPI0039E410BA